MEETHNCHGFHAGSEELCVEEECSFNRPRETSCLAFIIWLTSVCFETIGGIHFYGYTFSRICLFFLMSGLDIAACYSGI